MTLPRANFSKVFERFTDQAHLVLDLAREEADGLGHR